MRWRIEFHGERRRTLACYDVEASTPAAAAALGKTALVAEFPSARRRLSLFEHAKLRGGQHAGEWVLHRVVRTGEWRTLPRSRRKGATNRLRHHGRAGPAPADRRNTW